MDSNRKGQGVVHQAQGKHYQTKVLRVEVIVSGPLDNPEFRIISLSLFVQHKNQGRQPEEGHKVFCHFQGEH